MSNAMMLRRRSERAFIQCPLQSQSCQLFRGLNAREHADRPAHASIRSNDVIETCALSRLTFKPGKSPFDAIANGKRDARHRDRIASACVDHRAGGGVSQSTDHA